MLAGNTPYRDRALLSLIYRIPEASDREALDELLVNRRPCRWNGDWLTLKDFIYALRERFPRGRYLPNTMDAADHAYDLTVDKFTNLPYVERRPEDSGPEQEGSVKPTGPDCRYYYAAYLRHMESMIEPRRTQLEQESVAAQELQRFIIRHFYLSCAEVRRQANPYTHRYIWPVNGGKIELYMPKCMTGREKRTWLEKHIGKPRPGGPNERQRIQGIVDTRLNATLAARFRREMQAALPRYACTPLPWSVEHEVSMKGLAQALADEKAKSIDSLRPSIQTLGKVKLKKMIMNIFSALEGGEYDAGKIAGSYGLSKATYSRFAGTHRAKSSNAPDGHGMADLWENLAGVLANHAQFAEAARSAGVWDQVQLIVGGDPESVEEQSDE